MELDEAAGGLDDTVKAGRRRPFPRRSSQANWEQDHMGSMIGPGGTWPRRAGNGVLQGSGGAMVVLGCPHDESVK